MTQAKTLEETSGPPEYVVVEAQDPDNAQWLHPQDGLVDLKPSGAGEPVVPAAATRGAITAAVRFGLTPADMPAPDWKQLLEKHRFSLSDLSAAERELVARTDREGKGQVRRPADSRDLHEAVWHAMGKGLIYLEGEMPGGAGTKVTFYRLTTKGRRLRSPNNNQHSVHKTKPKRRRRAVDARTRARNDRLRRILRGI